MGQYLKDTPAEAEVRKTVMFDLKRVLASPHINEDLRTEAQKMMDVFKNLRI